MKLIYEIDNSPEYDIQETINEKTGVTTKKYKIKGVFSTIGEKNRNGRVYPKNIWEKEVANYQKTISSGSLNRLCEWQHPARTSVDPMEAVAAIDSLEIVGNKVMGEATLLDNNKANQLKSLIDNGIKISVSSRGVGKIEEGVVKEFKLLTYDLVDTPSDFNATMDGMVEGYSIVEGVLEDKEFMINEYGDIEEAAEFVNEDAEKTAEEMRDALRAGFANLVKSSKESETADAIAEKMRVNKQALVDELDNLSDVQLTKVFAFVLQIQD